MSPSAVRIPRARKGRSMTFIRSLLLRFAAIFLAAAAARLAELRRGQPGADRRRPVYTARRSSPPGRSSSAPSPASLATLVEHAVSNYGLPNGYIIGQEGSGAIIGGLRYGDGVLYTKLEAPRQVYWQGPSIGWDIGGDGNRTMMLVYNVPNSLAIYRRYAGVNGSAYLVGGLGMTVLANTEMPGRTVYIVPIRSGSRRAIRHQCRLSQVHAAADLESRSEREVRAPGRLRARIRHTGDGFAAIGACEFGQCIARAAILARRSPSILRAGG